MLTPTPEQPLRTAEFDRLFATSVLDATRVSATRLDLVLAVGAEATARDLAQREVECCSFFGFEFTHTSRGAIFSIEVPTAHTDVLDALTSRSTDGICLRRGRIRSSTSGTGPISRRWRWWVPRSGRSGA